MTKTLSAPHALSVLGLTLALALAGFAAGFAFVPCARAQDAQPSIQPEAQDGSAAAPVNDSDSQLARQSEALAAVVARHEPELMKIPHVAAVTTSIAEPGTKGPPMVISVEVDSAADIPAVKAAVPAMIENFPTEVVVQQEEGEGY